MKPTIIPPVHVELMFRQELEGVLEQGETLAGFVESAVREAVARRQEQAEFVRRGLAAIERTKQARDGIAASTVIAKVRSKLQAAKDRQKKSS